MASIVRLSVAARNALVDQIDSLINAGGGQGKINIYSGTIPATPETAASGTHLATCLFNADAFLAAVAGSASANAIEDEDSALVTGAAGWARITDSADNVVMDVNVAVANAALTLNDINIVQLATVSITSGLLTMPMEAT